jgi:hypothetical protein
MMNRRSVANLLQGFPFLLAPPIGDGKIMQILTIMSEFSLVREGVGSTNSDEGTYTLWCSIYREVLCDVHLYLCMTHGENNVLKQ